jgi:3-dehydroquinate synthase
LKKITQKIKVPFSYTVRFSRGIFNPENTVLKEELTSLEPNRQHRVFFVVESELLTHYPEICNNISNYCQTHSDKILMTAEPYILTGGENLKNFEIVPELCRLFDEQRLCRQSFVGIIGGGAFLDAVGFAASIVHRGIRQVRIPTTVLAQNDSGIGVKNGVNMFGKKNFVGTFAPPFSVINDFDFLDSLEYRDWISGLAEAFKVAIIKDAAFFDWLCDNVGRLKARDKTCMEYLVTKCAELHLEHIATSGDPFEFGSARPLDFGHWLAHKLEMLSNGGIRHGEAVATGLAMDSYYALRKGFWGQQDFDRLIEAFKVAGFKLYYEFMGAVDDCGKYLVLSGIEEFREHLGGELHITLPDGLGRKQEVSELDEELLIEAVKFLKGL